MHRFARPLTLFAALVVMVQMAACAGPGTAPRASSVMVPITDVKAVAGAWAGVASRTASDQDDWVEVTLNEDGTFEAFSARQIGVLQGKGTLTVDGGKMMARGPNGSAVLTLYDRAGRVLVLDFRDRNGVSYSGELRPKN